MQKKINSALISVFNKEGIEPVIKQLQQLGVTIYSTGGTQKFIEDVGITCVPVETLTNYPSILGGRVKTLHPSVFGGILARRENEQDIKEMREYKIPEIDLAIVGLYPFEETVKQQRQEVSPPIGEGGLSERTPLEEEAAIIEKIDIGGPSMLRAAAKNYKDVVVIAAKEDYAGLVEILQNQNGETTIKQRKAFAAKAFEVVMKYDIAINNYFNPQSTNQPINQSTNQQSLRYGENPHQKAIFYGDLKEVFTQLQGKELSYNNLVDVDAAIRLLSEFKASPPAGGGGLSEGTPLEEGAVFAIIKHTNVCGAAIRNSVKESWDAALAGDPESTFGGVLITNSTIDKSTAEVINEIFFEVLMAPAFDEDALQVLKSKKNRILLVSSQQSAVSSQQSAVSSQQYKSVLNGILVQDNDVGNFVEWKEVGGRETTAAEKEDLIFANILCKHLKSNAIGLVKNNQLIGKGCGQTSRIDALRQSLDKAKQFNFDLHGAVLASDAFFPFDDCVKIAHAAGIEAFIQPGGSIRDKDSIDYCIEHKLAMVITGMRHFRH